MKKIMLIGATSGIAQEAAKIWAERGDALFLAGRNIAKLQAMAEDLKVRGAADVQIWGADLASPNRHGEMVRKADELLGGIDQALIAYGSLGDQKACEKDFQLAEKEFQVNFLSALSVLTHLANLMESKKAGTIGVITSVAGDRGRQSNYVYGAAKGGLIVFLQGLRNRLNASGVAVCTIKPGFVDTPMTAHLKKTALFARPQAVARGIVKALDKKKDVVYLPGFWRLIMLAVIHVPETIFKRLKM